MTYTTTAALIEALRAKVAEQGIVAVSRRAGLTRDGLHKILTRPTTRGFDPIARVCEAVGFRLVATLEPIIHTQEQAQALVDEATRLGTCVGTLE